MKKVAIILSSFMLLTACVSKKKYEALSHKNLKTEAALSKTKKELKSLKKELQKVEKANQQLLVDIEEWDKKFKELQSDTTDLNRSFRELKKDYQELSSITSATAQQLQDELNRVKELQKELSEKEKVMTAQELALKEKEESLLKLSKQLEEREQRVRELEEKIAEKDQLLNALQEKLTKALYSFKDSGLTVEMKDGKVYVSLDNKLLFASGSHKVDQKGQKALKELAKVLKEQKDILIMVEGHTDDVPYSRPVIRDNWDLSVMRATSVVKVLTKNGVEPNHVIAAGRGEFVPKDKRKTKKARAKNRRIEIVISPKLDELYELVKKK